MRNPNRGSPLNSSIDKEIIFKWRDKKNKTINVGCIVKWDVKINEVGFWVAKKLKK